MDIKLLVMDVDGTLTDGRIYIGNDGEAMKTFDVKDGYGIVQFKKAGGIPVIITGRNSRIVMNRCHELGITELYQGINNKLECLKKLTERYSLTQEEIACIGDDLNDLACLEYAGLSACPSDALSLVKSKVDYVCECRGGRGAVREFIDWFMGQM